MAHFYPFFRPPKTTLFINTTLLYNITYRKYNEDLGAMSGPKYCRDTTYAGKCIMSCHRNQLTLNTCATYVTGCLFHGLVFAPQKELFTLPSVETWQVKDIFGAENINGNYTVFRPLVRHILLSFSL